MILIRAKNRVLSNIFKSPHFYFLKLAVPGQKEWRGGETLAAGTGEAHRQNKAGSGKQGVDQADSATGRGCARAGILAVPGEAGQWNLKSTLFLSVRLPE